MKKILTWIKFGQGDFTPGVRIIDLNVVYIKFTLDS